MPPKRRVPAKKPVRRSVAYGKYARRRTYARVPRYSLGYRYGVRGSRGVDGGSRVSRSYGAFDPSYIPVKDGAAKFVLAQLNPFHESAYGARVPDRSTAPSAHIYAFDTTAFNQGANSFAQAKIFLPNVNTAVVDFVGATSSTWTLPIAYGGATPTNRVTGIKANYDAIRPVAHGVRLSCSLPVTTAQGFVHICLYAESIYAEASWKAPQSISQMTTCVDYQRLPISKLTETPVIIVNKFLSEGAFVYRDTADDAHSSPNNIANYPSIPQGFMTIMIVVEGAAQSLQSLSAEIISHYEVQPQFSTTNPSSTQNAEPANTPAMDTASTASSMGIPVFEDNAEGMEQRITGTLNVIANNVADTAQRQVINAVVGLAGAATMRAAHNALNQPETVHQIK